MSVLERDFSVDEIRRDFRRVVPLYDFWGQITETEAARTVLEWAQISDEMSVLEVACGTGSLFEEIVARNPHGRNVGVDISEAMLERARDRLAAAPAPAYELLLANAHELPFDDDAFDVLVNSYMFDLLPQEDFAPILREFRRVLRPGGRLLISSMSMGTRWYHRFWFYVSKYLPRLMTGCRPVELDDGLSEAGFRVARREEISQNTFPSTVLMAELGQPDAKAQD